MKRFLILFVLIVFVTTSCAGPNKVGWTKPDFHQDEFEKDRKECIEALNDNLDSDTFGKTLERCLDEKGYRYEDPADKDGKVKKGFVVVGLVVGYTVLLVAAIGALAVLTVAGI